MVRVTLDRPAKKKLGATAIVAMKRNPKTGRIVNQEWWDYDEFQKMIGSLVHRSSDYGVSLVGYTANQVPRWMQWILGRPRVFRSEYVNYMTLKKGLARLVLDRLEEDKNRSKK